jgi:4-alpha-glucanotransferase
MVPDCVPWVMNELYILSLEIQSMPKDPHVRFGHLSRNPYRSVCTFSSHDMPTLRQWWDENWSARRSYYNTHALPSVEQLRIRCQAGSPATSSRASSPVRRCSAS